MADLKDTHPDGFVPPAHDEEGIILQRDWTAEEERKAKRK